MDDELQLISDGEGLAVIGAPELVDRFVAATGLAAADLGLDRLGPSLGTASAALQAGSEVAANSGRWMKLTEESAKRVKDLGLVKNAKTGNSYGLLRAKNGQFVRPAEFVKNSGHLLTNPAILAGAAGLMAQLAMQQTMAEITDYLAIIDEKVDDILRGQKDAVLADMVGVGLVIDEAMTIRETVGRVPEVTWSKVQATSITIARTQAYALSQLDALAQKLESHGQLGELADVAKEAESTVREWLAVLARCFQLQDALAVLELDRVLDASPEELDRYRTGLRAARQKRLDVISRSTAALMARMSSAAGVANARVLLHPMASRAVVESGSRVVTGIADFHGLLGIERDQEAVEAKRWTEAVVEVRDKAIEAGADGVDAARRLGSETFDRATGVFRSIDLDGDGIADKPRALSAAEGAGSAIKGAAVGAAGAVGSLFQRKRDVADAPAESAPAARADETAVPDQEPGTN